MTNINSRQNELIHLENYLKEVDTEVTMILQNLQWDRNHLEEKRRMVVCQYDSNHRLPMDKLVDHEEDCFLKSQGYTVRDRLLPSPADPDAATLVKLNGADIGRIINDVSDSQSVHKTGASCSAPQPLSLERLQAAYSAAERRALHDAVVARAPLPCALDDLALMNVKEEGGKEMRTKSRMELEAQLRDLRRRRARYRVPAKTRNYSAALRDVIAAQMELFTQTQDNSIQDMHIKTDDSHSNTKELHDKTPKETKIFRDDMSSKSYHSKEGKTLKSSKDRYSESRHSGQHERYENRKRRHDYSDCDYNSAKYYKTKESDRSRSNPTSQYKDNSHDTKSKGIDDGYSDCKANKERNKKYDDYDNRKQYRDKGHDHRKKSRTEDNLNASNGAGNASRNDDVYSKEKYRGSTRHRSNREKEDRHQYRNRH